MQATDLKKTLSELVDSVDDDEVLARDRLSSIRKAGHARRRVRWVARTAATFAVVGGVVGFVALAGGNETPSVIAGQRQVERTLAATISAATAAHRRFDSGRWHYRVECRWCRGLRSESWCSHRSSVTSWSQRLQRGLEVRWFPSDTLYQLKGDTRWQRLFINRPSEPSFIPHNVTAIREIIGIDSLAVTAHDQTMIDGSSLDHVRLEGVSREASLALSDRFGGPVGSADPVRLDYWTDTADRLTRLEVRQTDANGGAWLSTVRYFDYGVDVQVPHPSAGQVRNDTAEGTP